MKNFVSFITAIITFLTITFSLDAILALITYPGMSDLGIALIRFAIVVVALVGAGMSINATIEFLANRVSRMSEEYYSQMAETLSLRNDMNTRLGILDELINTKISNELATKFFTEFRGDIAKLKNDVGEMRVKLVTEYASSEWVTRIDRSLRDFEITMLNIHEYRDQLTQQLNDHMAKFHPDAEQWGCKLPEEEAEKGAIARPDWAQFAEFCRLVSVYVHDLDIKDARPIYEMTKTEAKRISSVKLYLDGAIDANQLFKAIGFEG